LRNLARIGLTFAVLTVLLAVFASAAHAQEPRPPRKGTRYTVKIDSSPQQAAIYLDDKKYGIVGYTPFTGKLNKGDYKLIIEQPGFKPFETTIRVDSKHKEFFYPLEKQIQPGVIDVQATADPNVAGSNVFVDGLNQGTAPLLVDVKDGRHQVEIKKEGFEPYTQWVDVKEGQRVTLTPVLKATVKAVPKGSLLVDADVPDAEVIVDGQKQSDTTPTLVDNLEEGPHIVEVRKAPAVPWKQTVYVKGGQRTKVTAELAATMTTAKKGGNIRVLSSVAGAEVWFDGKLVGTVPFDLTDVAPGDHLIEVRAKGYNNKEQRVTVNAGTSDIVKFDLVAVGSGTPTMGKIKVVSPVPEARVFVDGANVGTAPIEKEVTAGEHFVTVEQTGYAKFEQKIAVEAGQTVTVTAALRAVGKVRFLSTPQGAEVVLNGQPIGKTPLEQDVDVGEHVVTIRLGGYYDYEENVKVEGGKTFNVSPELRLIDTGATPEEVTRRKWGLTSYGARVMPFGDFTVDMAIGYPYWVEGRATVGVAEKSKLGWDIGVGFRSLLTNWEFNATARLRYFERAPFSFGLFGTIGGGGGFAGRNSFMFQGGVLNTITFGGRSTTVTITGRLYLDIWSDRLCGLDKNDALIDGAPDVCSMATDAKFAERLDAFGIKPEEILDRDSGARGYLSLVAEVGFSRTMNLFFIFEGAPFQSERAGHTNVFNGTMASESDPIYNGKLGLTLKF
jgi:hypothetical protein